MLVDVERMYAHWTDVGYDLGSEDPRIEIHAAVAVAVAVVLQYRPAQRPAVRNIEHVVVYSIVSLQRVALYQDPDSLSNVNVHGISSRHQFLESKQQMHL